MSDILFNLIRRKDYVPDNPVFFNWITNLIHWFVRIGVFKTVNSNVANDCHKPVNTIPTIVLAKQ